MSNIVQHYQTFKKKYHITSKKCRWSILLDEGFKPTIHQVTKDEDGGPIKYAKDLAERYKNHVHLVLLDEKNIDKQQWYRVFKKDIKSQGVSDE